MFLDSKDDIHFFCWENGERVDLEGSCKKWKGKEDDGSDK